MDNKKRSSEDKKLEKREKALLIANVAALTVVFAGIALFMTFGKRPNVSFEENRDLEKPPVFTWADYWDGKVTDQFAKYYNDTVPMRTTWKLFIANFRSCLGVKYDGGVTIVGRPPVIEDPPESDDTSRPANSIPAVVIPKPANSIPAVVIPGQSTGHEESGNSTTSEPTADSGGERESE
ncbi:MAG: hypothetical protein K2J80_03810 [Oscillospiraceae bacterium]|nr:hypothetical protein [Oscillospiraceae bacterium]